MSSTTTKPDAAAVKFDVSSLVKTNGSDVTMELTTTQVLVGAGIGAVVVFGLGYIFGKANA